MRYRHHAVVRDAAHTLFNDVHARRIVENPNPKSNSGFRPNDFRRLELKNLAVILPDDSGQEVINELEKIVDIGSEDAFTPAQVVIWANKHEPVLNRESRMMWDGPA